MNLDFSRYRTIGDVSFDTFHSQLASVNSPMLADAREVYDIVKGPSALYLAQLWYEAKYDTVRSRLKPTDYNPTNMKVWWEDPRGEPQGMTGTKLVGNDEKLGRYLTFDSYTNAAREWRRRVIDDPDYKSGAYKASMTLDEYLRTYADIHEVHPDSGKDTTSILAEVPSKLTSLYKLEGPGMATKFKKYTFRGLKNPVYLPDWLTVEIRIIPSSVAGWTSGQYVNPANFTSTTWHDTGNDSSSAIVDYNWAAGGGRRNVPGSYNGIFDGSRLIITQWFDELVGHAANPTGNVTSYAFEQAYGPGFEKSWEVGMWVHAGILQSMGRLADTSMYQHNYWKNTATGAHKDCPGQIRRRGLWSATERGVDQRIKEINDFLAGAQPPVTPPVAVYAKPSPIPELDAVSMADVVAPAYVTIPSGSKKLTAFFVGDRYRAIRDTPRLRYATKGSEKLNKDIAKGESFDVDFVFENEEGKWGYTPYGTRVILDDLVRVSDTKGE